MNRREFLAKSIEASLLGYMAGLTSLAAGEPYSAASCQQDLSALNPVSTYVKSYVPPEGVLDPASRQTLTFEVLGWGTDKKRQKVSTPVLGDVSVTRTPLSDRVEYALSLNQLGGETMTGRFLCTNDRGHPLLQWELEYAVDSARKDVAALCRTRQSGNRKGDELRMHTDGTETITDLSGPLLCRCGLLDSANQLSALCKVDAGFTILHEPSGLRPNQRFRAAETGVLPHGEKVPIRTFLQSGPATLPTHWIVDSEGRPLFMTVFLTSWALTAIN